jgi:hypothetical protein
MDTKLKFKNLTFIYRTGECSEEGETRYYLADNGCIVRFNNQNITGWWLGEGWT